MNKDVDFDLVENEEEIEIVLVEDNVQIETDIISDEKSIDFDIVDDNENVNIDLIDDNNTIDFNISDYDDTEIKEEIADLDATVEDLQEGIRELDRKKANKTQVNTLSSQVETNTTQIRQNKADISALNTKVDNIHVPTKTSELTNDSGFITSDYHDNTKQDKLISGQNIKTINNESILGSGNISVEGVTNYEELDNLPSINNVELKGNKTSSDLGVQPAGDYALRNEIPDVSDFITKDVNDLTYYTKTSDLAAVATSGDYDDLTNKPDLSVFATTTELGNEITNRENADLSLQSQIDAITSSSDVKDIVGTYQELQNYDTSTLGNDDIIKVLQDSTHSNAMTYYRWVITAGVGAWSYIGQEGPYYTKSESDTLLNTKQNQITSSDKLDSDLVDDTNQTNKFVTTQEKTSWNNKSDFSGDYDDLLDKPAFKYYTAEPDENRNVQVTEVTKTIDSIRLLAEYGMLDFTPIDLSEYDTATRTNMLHPYTQLPNGRYKVISRGRAWLGDESYTCQEGELIYKSTDEFVVLGYYVGVYYYWNSETEKYEGGFLTTEFDVRTIIEEYVITNIVKSGSFNVAVKDSGYYLFDYSSASGTTRRIIVNVEGTNKYYYPYNGTILIKSDKHVVVLGRENYIFEYDSTNQYYKQPLDIITALSSIDDKYDKTGGEIIGDVKIDGDLTLDIEDPDYDSGITITKALDTNLGTTMTLTGYANAQGSETNYRPIIRNVGTPSSNYDVANKKYVDDNVVVPTYHLVFLNLDGTVDTYASTINYATIKSNMTDPKEKDYLDVIWDQTRFYAEVIEVTDVNNGDIKFIADIEYAGIPRRMVFTLNPQSILTTTSITTGEIISNKKTSVVNNLSNDYYPSTNAVYSEFQRKPVVVWEETTPANYLKGIQANLSASPAWQLTNLDLTPYKRIKIYSCAGKGSTNASTTPAIVLEMSLDSRAVSTAWGNNYVGSTVIQKSNDNNRLATLTCAVSEDKTKFVVLWQTSLYGTAATTNNDIGADVYMIEGYYD